MQTTPVPSTKAIRIRRGTSIALSSVTIAVTGSVLALILARPAIYLGQGTYGMPPVSTILVESLWFIVLLPIGAVMLLSGLPRTAEYGPVPKVLCIAAFTMVGVTVLWPVISVLFGLLGALATLG